MEKAIIKPIDFIQSQDAWDKLSLPEKAEMMKVAVKNGIYNLNDIREKYNEFAEGGDTEEEEKEENPYSVRNMVKAIYQTNPKDEYLGEPSHHHAVIKPEYIGLSEEELDRLVGKKDKRGHRLDIVKSELHPSHPSRGTWNRNKFALTELGMQDPNYTMFGLVDGNQDPQAVLTYKGGVILPEVTVTPQGNYFFNAYDNIKLHAKALGGPLVSMANEYSKGGGIHIKKENRGKFTRLKERTGHSASWFKEHGTPAQKKMAVFALNSRKWKHGLGGNLFYPGGYTKASDYRYVLDDDGEWNRVANDEMGRVFQGLTITPAGGSGQPTPEKYNISYDARGSKTRT